MAKFLFSGDSKAIWVTWDGSLMFSGGPVSVFEGENKIGEFNSMEEIKAGKSFNLTSGGSIRVYYAKVFWFIWGVKVELNGKPLRGAQVQ